MESQDFAIAAEKLEVEQLWSLVGELGIHGEVRRIPGALSSAHIVRKGQKVIVPSGERTNAVVVRQARADRDINSVWYT